METTTARRLRFGSSFSLSLSLSFATQARRRFGETPLKNRSFLSFRLKTVVLFVVVFFVFSHV
jgi:hypothetical protein